MKYVCGNLKQLDRKVIPPASEVKFLPNREGILHRPADLYSDKDDLVSKLFEGDDVLPVGEFAAEIYRDALLELGLKTSSSITVEEVLHIAEKVERDSDTERAQALMILLDRRSELLSQSVDGNFDLKSRLFNLNWVKTSDERPLLYPATLHFMGEDSEQRLASPSSVVSSVHVYLMGSVRPTVDARDFVSLSEQFAWNSPPGSDEVIRHLTEHGKALFVHSRDQQY